MQNEHVEKAIRDELERQRVAVESNIPGCIDKGAVRLHGIISLDRLIDAAIAAHDLAVGEPVAFLKFWFNDGTPCCRVDMTEVCEPWLHALKPTITPLYPHPTLTSKGE